MKKLIITCILSCMTFYGISQFVPQPLNYPGPGYWAYYYSIVDPLHVWVGTIHEYGIPCKFSVKTTDGGNSWIFDSIPVPGSPNCISVCGWDSNTCFFTFMEAEPSVWKTTDAGSNWTNIISGQFTPDFINFYHAFSADTGLAMGDPQDGYFEIQRTSNGGASWTRVPSSSIPAPLPNEMGLSHSYSAVGDSIWFTTNKCRCFRSSDRGLTWNVADVFAGQQEDLGVCFSSGWQGVVWQRGTEIVVVTHDGGITWDTVPFPAGGMIQDMSRVPGFTGGFVVTAYKSAMRVYFTPDLFSTLQIIEPGIHSNGAVEFYNESTGWLGGGESGSNEIFKYTGVLTSIQETRNNFENLIIIPNPTSTEAIIKIPGDPSRLPVTLQISDLFGKILFTVEARTSSWTSINASQLKNGIYLISILSGDRFVGCKRWTIKR